MRRYWILGILCVLCALTVHVLGTELRNYQHPDRTVWMLRAQKLQTTETWNTLILGDSQAMSGIRPELFDSSFGKVYNLGLPSAQPEGMLSVLPYLEDHQVRTLIVNISPYSLYETEVFGAFLNYYRNEFISLNWPGPSRSFLYGKTGGEVLESVLSGLGLYRLNAALRNLSTDASLSLMVQPGPFPGIGYSSEPMGQAIEEPASLSMKMRKLREKNKRIEHILTSTDGFWTWRDFELPSEDRCDAEKLNPLPASIRFKARPEATRAWIEFLNQASTRVERIILIRIPFSDSWHDTVDRILPSGKVSSDIHGILKELDTPDRVLLLDGASDFSDADFYDWNHLDYCGAGRYTRFLLEQIGAQKK